MSTRLQLGSITVDVVQKNIKHLHLSVYPPDGRVRISAPLYLDMTSIRTFALSKLGWIKQQQTKLQQQARDTRREYLDRESHYLWGKRYLLEVIEKDAPPTVDLRHDTLRLHIRPGANTAKKQAVMDAWYRDLLKQAIKPLIAKWEPVMGVKVNQFFVRQMKTKWGTCRPTVKKIGLNTELVRKPPECLEYVVVHEMVHLLEASHNARFVAFMDQFLPQWRGYKEELNRLPLKHEGVLDE